jgi:phosphatidylserine decarboxylase
MYSIILLHWLYESKLGKYLVKTKVGHWIEIFLTSIIGKSANSNLSKSLIKTFIKNNNIDMTLYSPIESYNTFNEFFSRPMLNINTNRPIQNNYFIAPADSLLNSYHDNYNLENIYVKSLNVKKIFNSKDIKNHSLYIFYLSPTDYHRIHAPLSGLIVDVEHYGSFYDSVNPIALNSIPTILSENSRIVVTIKIEYDQLCYFAIVGALLVGSIILKDKIQKDYIINKGEEVGYFQFGGSTCVVSLSHNPNLQIIDYVNKKVNLRQNIY